MKMKPDIISVTQSTHRQSRSWTIQPLPMGAIMGPKKIRDCVIFGDERHA